MSDEHGSSGDGRFVTRIEAARIHLRCDVTTIDRRVADGSLRKYKFGRRTLFRLRDVLDLVVAEPALPSRTDRHTRLRNASRGSADVLTGWPAVFMLGIPLLMVTAALALQHR
ncbi:hypothetical protein FHR90_000683 [Endobacter medicaginis]|uniref:Helix-turn-helix domain-containing protein n=1 Tax=Endobacter medicaginis TaxID=1181271 RepID=A0A839UZZ6_9PROT|nr:hypothetical protein [Endobacter medicaginis]MBB3172869.1 hypothetical protein [Endobacter medicaginis]MCX5474795.1 hypothetical protein [Endobacter medicaginis]NVN30065.1 hypothetical protein [Endobacter medicaginis]